MIECYSMMKEIETVQHNQFVEYDRDEFWILRICNQEGFLEAGSRRMIPMDLLTSCDCVAWGGSVVEW